MPEDGAALASRFPGAFIFGAGTSSYQIEGAASEEGKGESIWDRFCRKRGAIVRGEDGRIACDHYHRFGEDIELMRRLGLDAYRFSVAWPRIQPSGRGAANRAGVSFYDRLIDRLLESGIEPLATLYHWDLPQKLQDAGGWGNRDTVDRFADYARNVAALFGDRVKLFATLNEPWMFAFVGHLLGRHAPGRHNPWLSMRVFHHAMMAHAFAFESVKSERPGAQVGISLSLSPVIPQSSAQRDVDAARRADLFTNRLQLDPLLRSSYPDETRSLAGPFFPRVSAEDSRVLARRSLDFVGINTYSRVRARYVRFFPRLHFWTDEDDVPETEFCRDGAQYTDMGQEVYPPALRTVLERLRDEYGNPPVYITENGASFRDIPEHGRVHDRKRTAYIEAYLAEAARALEDGCDLRGYFYWSLLDNFEWSYGYAKRLGIVFVDFDTQERIVKDSGFRYAEILAEHRKCRRTAV